MSTEPMLDPTSLLAPSELILLNGDQFAREKHLGERVELINFDAAVNARELGEAMLAAAFLANEQTGAVHLELRPKTALFGLRRYEELYVVPCAHAIPWPADSLESQVRPLAEYFQSEAGQERNHVSHIIYAWLREDRWHPWKTVGNLIYAGLAKRGLLELDRGAIVKEVLQGESGYVLPAQTAALATQQSIEPIRQLLATCRHTRPEVWNLLIQRIIKGVRRRRRRQ